MLPDSWKKKTRTLAQFTGLQTLVHGVMAISGFLIVRLLTKSEYAAYTIAASLQMMLNALTDCGIGWGLNAVGGRIWNDSARLRGLIATALRLRSYLAAFAIPVTIVSALFLLRRNGVGWPTTIALTAGVIATMWGTFLANIYAAPLRLRSLYTTVQKFDLFAAGLRFVLLAILASFFLNAVGAVLVTAITVTVQGMLLRQSVKATLGGEAKEDESDRRALLGLMKKQALATLFFAYQGQITIWLISVFGSAEKVADIGALSRLAILFALVGSVLSGVVSPTYARSNSLQHLLRLFGSVFVGYTIFATALLACSIFFPSELLWVLGGKYASLKGQVPWLVGNSVAGGFIWVVHSLALARGWVWHSWVIPVLTLVTQIAIIPVLDLSSIRDVLIFGLISSLPTLLVATYMASRGLWTSWRAGVLTPVAA